MQAIQKFEPQQAGQILLYQTGDGQVSVDVVFENETFCSDDGLYQVKTLSQVEQVYLETLRQCRKKSQLNEREGYFFVKTFGN
ncbi:MAG: hypothetical protein LBN93_10020 [Candidatus Symbiothrix sp.]|nr:hypothetical protein [Candidatus Symbiothrix sp.]